MTTTQAKKPGDTEKLQSQGAATKEWNKGQKMAMAGSLMAGFGALQQGADLAAGFNYNAGVSRRNAQQVRQAAQLQNQQMDARTQVLLGQQRAAVGKSGVTLEGSPLLALEETAGIGQLNQDLNTYYAAVEGQNLELEAANARISAKAARKASIMNAAGSLLTGMSKLY